jgi:hypothetical protein
MADPIKMIDQHPVPAVLITVVALAVLVPVGFLTRRLLRAAARLRARTSSEHLLTLNAAGIPATNAIVTWTTEYHGLAVAALRRSGRWIDDEVLAHIWPTHHENVHFYGTHSVDIDGELAKLDADGYRPLRGSTE